MLDHFTFNVPPTQYDAIVSFYLAALAPISYTKQFDFPGRACGLGPDPSSARFWIGVAQEGVPGPAEGQGFHLAFQAQDRETVKRFYEEAVKAGGRGNGEPGVREMYGRDYYAAFVLDPLGNNIEVVNRTAH